MAPDRGRSPLVSVVVPTYGRPKYLSDAAQSVLDQTHDRVELIIVDDHSPEPVGPLLSDLDVGPAASVTCIRHEENTGANGARNTGIRAADGAFVAFIDDDDTWHETKLERQLDRFADPEVGLVYTGQRYVTGDRVNHVLRPSVRGDVTEALLTGAPFGTFSTLMVRASVVDDVGLLDERFPCWQDREWPIRLSTACRVEAVDDPLVDHRMADHDQISDDLEAKRDVAYPLFVETFRPLAAEYGRTTVRKMVASRASVVATSALKVGRYGDARRFALRALRAWPLSAQPYLTFALSLGGRPAFTAAQYTKRAVGRHFR
ncbi:glycosyltransferase family 2 protein [Halomarina ordinaria]|uniref:Glycosyltransferase family 2 protein n=1 Tax=Halomarina ordinaria TaxID=3033939 RepID=A0ABD5UD96_9EURY|nr:glycosyltransferase family A protein [Halomarina sp. PSRA2]